MIKPNVITASYQPRNNCAVMVGINKTTPMILAFIYSFHQK